MRYSESRPCGVLFAILAVVVFTRPAPAETPPLASAELAARSTEPEVSSATTSPVTVLRARAFLDPGTGRIDRGTRLLVRDGKIAAIERDTGALPSGAQVIDLADAWVLPGLMDTHSHVGMATIPERTEAESSAFTALRALRLAREALDAGFTTLRDLGSEGDYVVSDLRRVIELGWVTGPTLLNAGKVIAPFGGQSGRHAPVPFEEGPTWRKNYIDADNAAAIVTAVRQNIYYGAAVIKLVADQKPYYYTEAEIRAAVDEAHRAGRKVAVHVAGGAAARNAILGGADSIEHGFDLGREELALMKAHGTFLSTTDFSLPQLRVIFQGNEVLAKQWAARIASRLEQAQKMGVRLAFGTDTIWEVPGRTRGELMLDFIDAYRDAGIQPMVTLRAMTGNAAELLGIADQRGSLRTGMRADLLAIHGNPLEDIGALRDTVLVMKDGQIVRDLRSHPSEAAGAGIAQPH